MDYSQLRAKIIQILDGELGIYTFVNKVSVPAIAIASNRPYPQPGTLVNGLEFSVSRNSRVDNNF